MSKLFVCTAKALPEEFAESVSEVGIFQCCVESPLMDLGILPSLTIFNQSDGCRSGYVI